MPRSSAYSALLYIFKPRKKYVNSCQALYFEGNKFIETLAKFKHIGHLKIDRAKTFTSRNRAETTEQGAQE
jgi:hypothetical protein